MPLNYADVELLNRSMENAGNAFATRRAQQGQERRDIANDLIRRKMLEVDQARSNATGEHEQRMETQFNTRAAQQDKQEMLKTVLGLNAGGQLDEEGIKQVNDWITKDPDLSKTGIHIKAPPQKAPPQAGQNSVAQALERAQAFRESGNTEYADMLENWARKQSTEYDTVSEEFPAEPGTPGTPAESHFFGADTPAIPPTPGTPKRTITRKVPVGAPAAPTNQAAKPVTDNKGVKWIYKGTNPDPTKDKDPKNWERAK